MYNHIIELFNDPVFGLDQTEFDVLGWRELQTLNKFKPQNQWTEEDYRQFQEGWDRLDRLFPLEDAGSKTEPKK